jgi:hypothetical protein
VVGNNFPIQLRAPFTSYAFSVAPILKTVTLENGDDSEHLTAKDDASPNSQTFWWNERLRKETGVAEIPQGTKLVLAIADDPASRGKEPRLLGLFPYLLDANQVSVSSNFMVSPPLGWLYTKESVSDAEGCSFRSPASSLVTIWAMSRTYQPEDEKKLGSWFGRVGRYPASEIRYTKTESITIAGKPFTIEIGSPGHQQFSAARLSIRQGSSIRVFCLVAPPQLFEQHLDFFRYFLQGQKLQ